MGTLVVLGELKLGENPDCTKKRGGRQNCAPKRIVRKITSESQIIVHEEYTYSRTTIVNDIALIRMKRAVPLFDKDSSTSYVIPVCLPWDSNLAFARNIESMENKDATITGWGKISLSILSNLNRKNRTGVSSPHLRTAITPIKNKICEADGRLKNYFNPDLHICAGEKDSGGNSCQGDSGGPLVIRDFVGEPWYQIGIVSFGLGGCTKDQTGFYTRLDTFLPWIKQKLEP